MPRQQVPQAGARQMMGRQSAEEGADDEPVPQLGSQFEELYPYSAGSCACQFVAAPVGGIIQPVARIELEPAHARIG